tara:strand:- start:454 stop:663 length:210 start_codon:yes stop_codon:yes gene_type:complete
MAYKQKGWSPFKLVDDKNKQKGLKAYIKKNMGIMSDAELMKAVRSKSDNKTEYNWNTKTGEAEAHDKPK